VSADQPQVLRGTRAIAALLDMSPAEADHMIRLGLLPAWRAGGTPYATVAGLLDWRALQRAGKLPVRG
jgi:hypothetical protein